MLLIFEGEFEGNEVDFVAIALGVGLIVGTFDCLEGDLDGDFVGVLDGFDVTANKLKIENLETLRSTITLRTFNWIYIQ